MSKTSAFSGRTVTLTAGVASKDYTATTAAVYSLRQLRPSNGPIPELSG